MGYHNPSNSRTFAIWTGSIFAVIAFIVIVMAGLPKYNVYRKRQAGMAALAEAEFNRKVQIADAAAKVEAAVDLARADSIRAEGVANANRIIGTSLTGNEGYLRWAFIEMLKETEGQIIYIPTEGSQPITEATRLRVVPE